MKNTTLLTLFLLLISFNLFSQAGSLDESFGINGVTTTDNSTNDWISDLAIQADGKIVAVGLTKSDANNTTLAVVRYKTDGFLDSSFGNNGIATFSALLNTQATSVELQSDGKITVGVSGYPDADLRPDFAVARILPNGTLDKSFGNNGIVSTDINGADNEVSDIVIQPDGKIIAVGTSFLPLELSFSYSITLVRYNADGSLDKTFGTDGIVDFQKYKSISLFSAVAGLTSNGKIVVASSASTSTDADALLMRFKSNGNLDSAFGNNGFTLLGTDKDDINISRVKILPDNKILLGGTYYKSDLIPAFMVIKRNADGSRDDGFGQNGLAKIRVPGSVEGEALGMDVQQDGKIILVGYAADDISQRRTVLVRYLPNGTPDNTFGKNGLTYLNGKGYGNTYTYSVAIQNDGKIVTAGVNIIIKGRSANPDFMLARFNGDSNFAVSSLGEKNNATIADKKISLFPNPASNTLTVTGLNPHSSTTVSIIDNTGKVVAKTISINQPAHTINLSNLKPGLYFLQLKENNNTTTLKFLKQ